MEQTSTATSMDGGHVAPTPPAYPLLLLTVDLHPWREAVAAEMRACMDYLSEWGVRATFFTPGVLARRRDVVAALRSAVGEGHQVACHGLLHAGHEDFGAESVQRQRRRVRLARRMLEDAVGRSVTCFRAPAFRILPATIVALEEEGFVADLSVTSQRLPLLSSQPWNLGPLVAPRDAYHPRPTNPYRRGDMSLWEIPTTAFVVPYTSFLHQALGLRAAEMMTRLFFLESRVLRRPVVHMCHAEEFVASHVVRRRPAITVRDFLPASYGGIKARELLYERDEFTIYRRTIEFSRLWMEKARGNFVTADDYIQRYLPVRPQNSRA